MAYITPQSPSSEAALQDIVLGFESIIEEELLASKSAKNMKLPGQRRIIYDEYLSEIAVLDEKRKEIES
ncbi:hypothetical protein G6F52_003962 [Rhizopus delemar]|nr:hypothetical protein G6F52_003962 [Rhizopus delemar]